MSGQEMAVKLVLEIERLRVAIRKHRDQRGDDRCWRDNEELWAVLPEGYSPPDRDELVEIENCKKYIASCHRPDVEYVSPQRRIEELETWMRGTRLAIDSAWEAAKKIVESDYPPTAIVELWYVLDRLRSALVEGIK